MSTACGQGGQKPSFPCGRHKQMTDLWYWSERTKEWQIESSFKTATGILPIWAESCLSKN